MARLLLSFCILLLPLMGCAHSVYEEINPEEGAFRLNHGGSIQAEVSDIAKPLIDSGENVGIIVGVVTPDDQSHIFSFGKSSLGAIERIDRKSIFGVGSLTKSFVAALVAIMVDEGKLSYEETLRDIMPADYVIADERVAKITVRQLVTHTAGFEREPWNVDSLVDIFKFLVWGDNPYDFIDKKMARTYLASVAVEAKDHAYVYSNVGMGYLGQILQIRSGKSLNELLQEKICLPLGLSDTTYVLSKKQMKRLVQGYSGDYPKLMRRNQPVLGWSMRDSMQGAAGIHSTLDDLLVFAKVNLGLVDHPLGAVFKKTHEVFLYNKKDEDVAYGWFVQKFPNSAQKVFYQYGLFGGHNAYLGFDDDRKTAVVVLRNNFNWRERIGTNLLRRLAF